MIILLIKFVYVSVSIRFLKNFKSYLSKGFILVLINILLHRHHHHDRMCIPLVILIHFKT